MEKKRGQTVSCLFKLWQEKTSAEIWSLVFGFWDLVNRWSNEKSILSIQVNEFRYSIFNAWSIATFMMLPSDEKTTKLDWMGVIVCFVWCFLPCCLISKWWDFCISPIGYSNKTSGSFSNDTGFVITIAEVFYYVNYGSSIITSKC